MSALGCDSNAVSRLFFEPIQKPRYRFAACPFGLEQVPLGRESRYISASAFRLLAQVRFNLCFPLRAAQPFSDFNSEQSFESSVRICA